MAHVRIKSHDTPLALHLLTDMYKVLNTNCCTIIAHHS